MVFKPRQFHNAIRGNWTGKIKRPFTSFNPSLTCAASTVDGNSISVSGQRELGPLRCAYYMALYDTIAFLFYNYLTGINVTFIPSGVTIANGVASVCGRREGGIHCRICVLCYLG